MRLLGRLAGFAHRWVLAVFGSAYAFSLGLVSRRHRGLMLQAASHFGYRYKKPSVESLPKVALQELFPKGLEGPLFFGVEASREDPGLLYPVDENGSIGSLDLAAIVGLLRARQPKAIFEIGTFLGSSTYNLALNSPPDCKVFTLDLPQADINKTALPVEAVERQFIDKPASGLRFKGTAMETKITQLFGDSASFDFSPYENRMDFVFVDGSHSYEYVLSDAHKALKLLRGGKGLLLFHDYGSWEGVTRALNELASDPAFAGLKHVAGTPVVMLER